MKIHKLILMSTVIVSSVIPTQAAVYGTLKQDMIFNLSEENIVKKPSGSGVSILEEDANNYVIQVAEDTTEVVNKNLVKLSGIISETTVEGTKVNAKADPDTEVLTTLKKDEMVMVLEKVDNYYKIKVDNTVGYIYKSQLNTDKLTELEKSSSELLREEVVSYAKKYVGGKYVYGGTNLNTGVDCSGFVQQIMKQFGISMARSSRSQYATNGVKVSVSELEPGDLVYYGNGGVVNHAAIYIGNGQIVHASDERSGIKISKLNYGKPIIGAKRVIQ